MCGFIICKRPDGLVIGAICSNEDGSGPQPRFTQPERLFRAFGPPPPFRMFHKYVKVLKHS